MKHTKYLHIHDWNYWWGYYLSLIHISEPTRP